MNEKYWRENLASVKSDIPLLTVVLYRHDLDHLKKVLAFLLAYCIHDKIWLISGQGLF